MKPALSLQIITPAERGQKVEGVVSLTLPLIDGSIGILPGHAPLLANTTAGSLIYRNTDGKENKLVLPSSGILLLETGNVIIFLHGMETISSPIPARLLRESLAAFEMDYEYAREA